jgi:hypothetical protein
MENLKFLSGIRDVDLIILAVLDDQSLFSLCLVNKYTNNLCKNEDFWRKRFYENFVKDITETNKEETIENITWRKRYLKKIYEEKSLFVSKLNEVIFSKSPWLNGFPVVDTSYYHDEADNWLLVEGVSGSIIYISQTQTDTIKPFKYRVAIEWIRDKSQKNKIIFGIVLDDEQYKHIHNMKYNPDDANKVRAFLQKKEKLYWLNALLDPKSLKESLNEIKKYIPNVPKKTFTELVRGNKSMKKK